MSWFRKLLRRPARQPTREKLGDLSADELAKLLKDGDLTTRLVIVDEISRRGESAVPALTQLLNGEDSVHRGDIDLILKIGPSAKTAACVALAKIGHASHTAVPALLTCLSESPDEVLSIRIFSTLALAAIGPPAKAAVPNLIQILQSQALFGRKEAAQALGRIGSDAKDAVSTLVELLQKEKDAHVRMETAFALGFIGAVSSEVVPALIEALKYDRSQDVQCRAAMALGRIGPPAKEAMPALRSAATLPNMFIRDSALASLQRIRDPSENSGV